MIFHTPIPAKEASSVWKILQSDAIIVAMDEYGISCKTRTVAGELCAYYTVRWSPLSLADRWTINAKVPALGGIYEIYRMDDHKRLRLLSVGAAHYGGLRSELRRLTDPELCTDADTRKILEDDEIWFRYTVADLFPTMQDIVWFFRSTYMPEAPGVDHSGRYEKIFLQETDSDKLRWVE
jgi:hypothetical protein